MRPSHYRTFEEFQREELRPGSSRVGFNIDDLIEESTFDGELEFDQHDDEE